MTEESPLTPTLPDDADEEHLSSPAPTKTYSTVPDAQTPNEIPQDDIGDDELEDIRNMCAQLDEVIAKVRPHPDQYQPIDRRSLITAMFVSLDEDETGFLTQEAFRTIATMIRLNVSNDAEYRRSYLMFCGEYGFDPMRGIEVSWLRHWINNRNSEGYIPGNVLHNYLFGVYPRPAKRETKVPPQVSPHPVDVMTKTIQAILTPSSSTAPPPMVFPPPPPGLVQPGTLEPTTPTRPMTLAGFPKPPPSLRIDPYELTLPRIEPEPNTDEEAEAKEYGRNA